MARGEVETGYGSHGGIPDRETAMIVNLTGRYKVDFLGLIKPSTDLSQFKAEDFKIIRCKCGCNRTAKVLKTSEQKYLSELCRLNSRGNSGKKDAQEQWRREMKYFVQG